MCVYNSNPLLCCCELWTQVGDLGWSCTNQKRKRKKRIPRRFRTLFKFNERQKGCLSSSSIVWICWKQSPELATILDSFTAVGWKIAHTYSLSKEHGKCGIWMISKFLSLIAPNLEAFFRHCFNCMYSWKTPTRESFSLASKIKQILQYIKFVLEGILPCCSHQPDGGMVQ